MKKSKKTLNEAINEIEKEQKKEQGETENKEKENKLLTKKPEITEHDAITKKQKKTKLAVACFVLLLGVGIMGNWYYENADVAGKVKPLVTSSQVKTLGEAEYVDATTVKVTEKESEYFSSARLDRQKARDEAIEKLQKVIDKTDESEAAKQEASQSISLISNYIAIENKIETLVKAKGVNNCLAVVSNDGIRVDVIVDSDELTDSLILQIKEIAMQQLDCSFENVSIIQSK